jgi:predicted ribosomally synthesized peptide with nif11-like leader
MEGSQISQFIERIKSDEAFRQRIIDAEQAAARDVESISQIAAEAGYDISGEIGRPATMQPTPTDQEMENATCVLTCCWVETSVWDTEGPSIGGF